MGLLFLISGIAINYADAIACYFCLSAASIPACTSVVPCSPGSSCFSEYSTVQGNRLYSMGCRATAACPVLSTVSSGGGPIVGRSASVAANCSECCSTSNCNNQLCQGQVIDDGGWSAWSSWSACDVTCGSGMRSKTRTCSAPAPQNGGSDCPGQAKLNENCTTIACSVDGSWSAWSSWSACDVTCGSGMRTKTRTCSAPAPQNGGSDCPGQSNLNENCTTSTCPVDGSWSAWSSLSACDVTCGSGIRTKTRTCSAPAPQNGGSNCPGQSKLNENCTSLCPVNGGWSVWATWGQCSSSCDIGLQRRDRNCSQPYPANNGDHCFGDSHDYRICAPGACADGVWSTWGSWGVCTKTCGGGVKTRNRGCDNPAPSMTGKYCSGNPIQTVSCNASSCRGHAVGFTMVFPIASPTKNQLTFKTVISSVGGGFNIANGVFTCPVAGTYFFSASLVKNFSYTSDVYCYIRKNHVNLVAAYTYPGQKQAEGFYGTGNSAYVHLNKGDRVTLEGCSPIAGFYQYTSFSGVLVTPDIV